VYMSTWANLRAWHMKINQSNNIFYSVKDSKLVLQASMMWNEIPMHE
jgi:hypothetical protein